MNASGATSIVPVSSSCVDAVRREHVVQRVVQGAQVGVDLRLQVAGEEAEPLARLDRGAREDHALDLARGQRLDGHGDGQVRLAGAGRADPERDRVVADGVHVAPLVDGLRLGAAGQAAPAVVVAAAVAGVEAVQVAVDDLGGVHLAAGADRREQRAEGALGLGDGVGSAAEAHLVAAGHDLGAQRARSARRCSSFCPNRRSASFGLRSFSVTLVAMASSGSDRRPGRSTPCAT
jgi:hypothetical protein